MLTNILLGVLGIVLYTLIKSRKYVLGADFDWMTMKKDNLIPSVLSALTVVLVVIILQLVPEASLIIGQVLGGVDLDNSPVGMLGFGMLLMFGSKEITK